MHELGIAQAIVEAVEEEARAAEAERVLAVTVAIGELSGVVAPALKQCFPIATQDTMLEGARLDLEQIDGEGYCLDCEQTFPLPRLLIPCPDCGGYTSEIRAGQEMTIVSIEVKNV